MAELARGGRRSARTALTAALLLLVLTILLSLGTWQMQRLAWKDRLLADIAERHAQAAVELTAIESMWRAGGDIEYRPVILKGTFEHDKERHFFATWHGQSGYHIYTPVRLADGRHVFVNRGFVPFEKKDPGTRKEPEVNGEQQVVGLARARLDGKPSSLVPDNDLAKNIFYWKDLDAMASSTGIAPENLVPFFVDADNTPNPGGLPVGGVTQFELPNNHLQYALTWYGLAAALVGVSGIYFWRSRRR